MEFIVAMDIPYHTPIVNPRRSERAKTLYQRLFRDLLTLSFLLPALWSSPFAEVAGFLAGCSIIPAATIHGEARNVAVDLRRRATRKQLAKNKRKAVDKCADQLDTYLPMLEYDSFLSDGLPIASGVIEGT